MNGPDDAPIDLLVVGAGTGGCAAALAARGHGLSVLLVDRREFSEIGTKACGDAMEAEEVRWCEQVLGVDLSPAILKRALGARITTSDGRHSLVLGSEIGERIMMDRPAMGRLLLSKAMEAGARFSPATKVVEWLVEDGVVRGVRTSCGVLRARCTVDASGAISGLRQRLDSASPLERESHPSRMAFAYREIATVPQGLPHPGEIELTYDLGQSNGGYVWYFPNGDHRVNVGIGGVVASLPWSRRLADHGRSWGIHWQRESAAGAFLPARTFLSCAVAPGYLACGDAACCVGPLDGAGIHSSLLSGYLAGRQCAKALRAGEATLDALWGYQGAYLRYTRGPIRDHGAGISAQEALRPLLQKLSQEEFDSLVRLADPGTVTALYSTSWRSIPPLLAVLAKLSLRPRLVAKLARAVRAMTRLRAHLLAFPDTPATHPAWESKLGRLLRRAGVEV
ncbi:MAG TPA: geranylgeranyl reductase family protein [Fibrobacteria bacterium]|mgnify:CR=1 FL=1|nr:geranylgeranyl reductase family protein [Fibrobacteria bacterium]